MKLLSSSNNVIENLSKIKVFDSFDLVSYLPYRYERYIYTDESIPFTDKQRIIIVGKLVSNPRLVRAKNLDIVSFHFISRFGRLYTVKAYNREFLTKILNLQDEWTIIASYNEERKELSLMNYKKGEIPLEERIKPLYHLPNDLQSATFSNLMKRTFEKYEDIIPNVLPTYLIEKYKLLRHSKALHSVHFPKKEEDITLGFRTLKFEECMDYCLRNKIVREENRKLEKIITKEMDKKKINQFILDLPYKLSSNQVVAVREIVLDMEKKSLMYRLLQGDVGTGKTLVALIALYANYLRNNQGVLLAPTDSLARQHYESAIKIFKSYSINVELMVGAITQKERKSLLERLKNGEIDILIGTHAVFSNDVVYPNLGLAIIDEQHRFGVNQRNLLASKGDQVDLLLMSATPIPRTLSLSIYGDLDVSSLSEYPLGKREVKTKVVDFESEKIDSLIDYTLKANRQVFMVCPKISETNKGRTVSAEEIYEKYKNIYHENIGLLHGKMSVSSKTELLDKFTKGEIPILVCTTVVELGIDVKTAGAMIVFSANAFGLASLHQLRGRVGRDGEKAFCLLVEHFDEEYEDDGRLEFLETCSDGFMISEEDLKRRGPGDFAGIEQSGFPTFNSLNIVSDLKMFEVARDEVSYIMNNLNNEEILHYYNKTQEKMKKMSEDITLFD